MPYRYTSGFRTSARWNGSRYRSSNRSSYRGGGTRAPSRPAVNYMQTAVSSAPPASPTMFVFPWNISNSSYNISTFSAQKTNNVINSQKFNEVMDKVKGVNNFKPVKSEGIAAFIGFCSFLVFITCLIFYIILLVKGKVGFALAVFFGGIAFIIFMVTFSINSVESCYKSKLKQRGKSIKKILLEVNKETQKKGVIFNTGIYGAYITLEIFGNAIPTIKNTTTNPPASNTNEKMNAKQEDEKKKKEEEERKKREEEEKQKREKELMTQGLLENKRPVIGSKVEGIGNPFDVQVKNNPNNIQVYEPGNIGHASVVDPNKESANGTLKPYNPPIIDVNVDR